MEYVDADGDPGTAGLAVIARLTLDVDHTEVIPLDFSLGEDLPVSIETGGDMTVKLGGELQLDFGIDLSEGLALADRAFLVGYDGVSDTGTAAKLTAQVDAPGLSLDIVIGGLGGANVVSGGEVRLKDLHTSTTSPPNANNSTTMFTINTPVPAGEQPLAFVSVGGEIQHSDSYTINPAGTQITFTAAPVSGEILVYFPDDMDPASLRLELVDIASPDPLNKIPFSELFDGGDGFALTDFINFSGIDGMIGELAGESLPHYPVRYPRVYQPQRPGKSR